MLAIDAVSKKFSGGHYGVRDLSLQLDRGVVGLLGPNGAGKTTLMQMIATITRPTSGSIRYDGTDITKKPDELRRVLGYLPQDFGVYENLTATEFLRYFAALKGVSSRSRIHEMLEAVNLHTTGNRLVGGFSGGMKQRLGIAQALINDPAVLIVDEPTAGLDPEERVRLRNILSDLGEGRLILFSTHIVSDIEAIATEIAIMRGGQLIAHGAPETLMQRAAGSVWKMVMPSEDFDRQRATLKISTAVRRPDGVHIRVVSQDSPFHGASSVEPELEDAFLYSMNYEGQRAQS